MLEIRPISAGEIERYIQIATYSFQLGDQAAQRTRELLVPEQTLGVFAGGDLVAGMIILPLSIWLGGRGLGMGGIAMVATAPEHRGRGYLRALITRSLVGMRERGLATSILYPASYPLYSRFGWGICGDIRWYTLRPGDLPGGTPASGSMRPADDEDIPVLDSIYEDFARQYNCCLVRTEGWWRDRVLRRSSGKNHAFLWSGDDGQARGYAIYGLEALEFPHQKMIVREIVARDGEAHLQLLKLLAGHNLAREIQLPAPADDRLFSLLADPRVETEIRPWAMFRLVDAAAALAERPYPPDVDGRFLIRVHDACAPWNDGLFSLEISGGRGRVEMLPATAAVGAAVPDAHMFGNDAVLECDIGVLSQVFSGYLMPDTAARLGLLKINDRKNDAGALAGLQRAFATNPVYLPLANGF